MLLSIRTILTIAVGLLGGVALLGWVLNVDLLKRVAVSGVPMKANTAACLLLLSGALVGYRQRVGTGWRRLGAGCAALAAMIALATLGEYVFGWRLGVDQFLFSDHAIRGAPYPGRPAFNTALGVVLVAGAIVLLDVRLGRWWPSHALAGAAGALGLLALAGTATGTTSLGDLATGQAIATTTALGLVMLSGATLLARLDHGAVALFSSPSAGGVLLRWLLPVAVAAPLVLAGLALAGKDAGLYGVRVGAWLDASAMIAILASLAWALAVVIERRSAERGLAQHAFLAMSQTSTDAVVTVDGQGTIRYVNRGGEAMFGYQPAELVGEPLGVLFPEPARAEQVRRFDPGPMPATVTSEDPVQELRIVRQDGRELRVEVSRAVSRDGW